MENSLTSMITSNPQVIELFKEELPTFQQLHNGADRQVYPHITKAKENLYRKQFGIPQSETLLYVQDLNLYNRNEGSFEIMGFAMTDLGIRFCFSDAMTFTSITFDQNLYSKYDSNSGLVYFYDERSQIKNDENYLPIFIFVNGLNNDSLSDKYGDFFVSFFNKVKKIAIPADDAENLIYKWHSIYNDLQYKRERSAIIEDMKRSIDYSINNLASAQNYQKTLKIPHIWKLIAGTILVLISLYYFNSYHSGFIDKMNNDFCGFIFIILGAGGLLDFFLSSDMENYRNEKKSCEQNIGNLKSEIENRRSTLDVYISNNPECLPEETLEKWVEFRKKSADEYVEEIMQSLREQDQEETQISQNNSNNKEYGIMDAVGDFNNGVKIGKALYTLAQLFG